MKKISFSIALALLVFMSAAAIAQSSNGKKTLKENKEGYSGKQKSVSADDKKSASPLAGSDLKTDEKNRTYKTVDGRKVLVDNQGIQSLVNPDPVNAKQPENQNNSLQPK